VSRQSALLRSPRFLPFFLTQFLGAFNDNLYKNGLVVLLTFQAAGWTTLSPALLGNLAAGIFILPFFLFSATAGQLADKFDKAGLSRLVKLLEMAIMAVALVGFLTHSLAALFGALFLLGCHSTLFGPVKYALLPQHLHADELIGGNALVEAGTFVAILAGTLAGGLLAAVPAAQFWIPAAGFAVAAVGYLASRHIPPAPPPVPGLAIDPNPFTATRRNLRYARENPTVLLAIMGISWFWLYGALFLAQFPAYAKLVLGGGEGAVTLLLATFTVGIGVGSLLCERLSGSRVELGLVPFGSLGLTLFGLDLALASPATAPAAVLGVGALLERPGTWRLLADLTLLGTFGGFFIVPLYALVQSRSAVAHRARVIAANNILNALFMVAGALAAAGLLAAGLSIPALFGAAALVNALVALLIYRRVPEFPLRFVLWLLTHSLWPLRARGLEHIPATGPALLVGNRHSPADALLLLAVSPRPVRCLVAPELFRQPLLGFVLRHSGAIPTHPVAGAAAYAEAARSLAAGELVGHFLDGPPGAPELTPFPPALAPLLAHRSVPVVPLALRGATGKGRLFRPVELVAGQPMAAPGDQGHA
jgi:1-acyl-sn-glycerol-3-phosphate acyltransferase